ncbi:Nucleosomal histone H3-Lys79 methylase [Gryganskiella cystojenkinii]|nr:Nucleosomal histone H3-Lys79 methylase [Gryganskiella cystojenkinii]
MTESIVPAQASPASFSSTSSLSSPSPDRSNRTSPDPESGLGLNSVGPSPYSSTPSELDSVADSPNPLDKKQNLKESGQGNLVLELFGALSKPKTVAIDTRGLQDEKKRLKKPVELDDDEAFLGTVPPQPNTISKPASKKKPGLTNGKRVSPNDTLSREIVVINPTKGSVSTRTIDVPSKPKVAQSNGKASGAKSGSASASPSKPTTSSLSKKLATATDSGATSTSTSNGSAIPRRMSLLHSDQIVAAAMGRYKNHFHMLVEDSDSTVASNPSSTGGDTMHVSLEYPGKDSREKFTLMKPFLSRSKAESDDKDEYNPIEDLIQTVRTIMEYFFTPEQYKELFGSQNEGLYRSLTKYKVRKDGAQFMKAVEEFNTIMRKQKASGAIESHIKQYGHRLPYDLVVHILGQVYSRTVAARASKLNNYEAFSNNVYGEILPILTKEFIQRAKLDHTKVFVDLGCGIGNVVLQVALQTGAESYGVEIMDTPAKFAKKQASEFEARSRAYGLNHGSVKMIKGDFLDTPELVGILARADVVLVNNYAFNSALNQSLLQLFLDLKEGCKIISLKTFVPLDHKINVRNAGSVESILRVKKYPYYTNAVSWTHNGGEYFVATVDRAPVQAFYERGVYDDGGGRRSSSRRH